MLRTIFAMIFWTVLIAAIIGLIIMFGLPLLIGTVGLAVSIAVAVVALILFLIFIVFIIG
jgi:hypothetical protein